MKNPESFHHLSAGELLRAEMNREGSKYGKMIMEINQAGKINPSWLTVGLIETAIKVRVLLGFLHKSDFCIVQPNAILTQCKNNDSGGLF